MEQRVPGSEIDQLVSPLLYTTPHYFDTVI
jgi:hypothetical protein